MLSTKKGRLSRQPLGLPYLPRPIYLPRLLIPFCLLEDFVNHFFLPSFSVFSFFFFKLIERRVYICCLHFFLSHLFLKFLAIWILFLLIRNLPLLSTTMTTWFPNPLPVSFVFWIFYSLFHLFAHYSLLFPSICLLRFSLLFFL